ncbi:hypothetical protein SAMN05216466_12174 [Paraburkholderia phenazinium]|uniref:Uncharacterized protein n=1 Tax=Paraburkholderia phenazinium TaxID=60549 RepID=A0A1G8JWG4_9BURK|nr:hypothetical protein SAMN05216466_12174 [Paraburkholderia phenazinium]
MPCDLNQPKCEALGRFKVRTSVELTMDVIRACYFDLHQLLVCHVAHASCAPHANRGAHAALRAAPSLLAAALRPRRLSG